MLIVIIMFTPMITLIWEWTTHNWLPINNTLNSKRSREFSSARICQRLGTIVHTPFIIIMWIVCIFANSALVSLLWPKNWSATVTLAHCIILPETKSIVMRRRKLPFSRSMEWRIQSTVRTWHSCRNCSWIIRICTTTWVYSYSIYYVKFKMDNIILLAISQKYHQSYLGKINW